MSALKKALLFLMLFAFALTFFLGGGRFGKGLSTLLVFSRVYAFVVAERDYVL